MEEMPQAFHVIVKLTILPDGQLRTDVTGHTPNILASIEILQRGQTVLLEKLISQQANKEKVPRIVVPNFILKKSERN